MPSRAHRHVTARAARAVPPGTVAGYPAFGAEAHRPSALARHLLAQAGEATTRALAELVARAVTAEERLVEGLGRVPRR